MKRLEEMSREELIEEIISSSERLGEIEAARQEKEREIVELEKHVKLLTYMKEAISNGQSDMSEFILRFQELAKLKDERIAKLQRKIKVMKNEARNSLLK